MSDIISSAPTGSQPVPRESSPLISPRDPSGPGGNWRHIAQAQRQSSAVTSLAGLVNRQTSRGDNSADANYGMHPFKVYNVPFDFLGSNIFDPEDNWRIFTMRTGCLFEASYGRVSNDAYGLAYENNILSNLPGLVVLGDSIPYLDQNVITQLDIVTTPFTGSAWSGYTPAGEFNYFISSTYNAFKAKENAVTWVWLELYAWQDDVFDPLTGHITYAVPKASDDPANCGWNNFPNRNPYMIPIAVVDTRRFADKKFAVVNQLRYDNIDIDYRASGYYGKLQGAGNINYDSFGGRGVPMFATVANKLGSNHGLYSSRHWFNNNITGSDFPVDDNEHWTKIADLT